MAVLEVQEISKSFNAILAVSNVSFTANRGEILGFLGPNGAGKTTTIRMIMGIIRPDTGAIRFAIDGTPTVLNKEEISYLPMMFLKMLIEHPNLPWIRVAGFFPSLAPCVMMIRIAVTRVPWWEVVLSLTLLAATVCLLARFAAKVFGVGMLMYGKSANLREIWKWGIRSSRT